MLSVIQHSPACLVWLCLLSLGHANELMLYKIDKVNQIVIGTQQTVTIVLGPPGDKKFIVDGESDISSGSYKIGNREQILPGTYQQFKVQLKKREPAQIVLRAEEPELDIHEELLQIFFGSSITDTSNRIGFLNLYQKSDNKFGGLALAINEEGENGKRQFTTRIAGSGFDPLQYRFTFYFRCRNSIKYEAADGIQLVKNQTGVWCFEDLTIQLDVFQYYHKLRRMDRTKNYRASFNPASPNQIKLSELDLTGSEDYDILISLDGIVLEKYSITKKYKIDQSLSSCILEKVNSVLPEPNLEEVLVSFFKPGTPPTLQSRVVGDLTMEKITIAENSSETRECVKLTDEPLTEHYSVLTKMPGRIDYNPSEDEELFQLVHDKTLWVTKPRYTPVEATLYDFWGIPFGRERNEINGYNAIALGSSKTRNSCLISVPGVSQAVELEKWLSDEICYFKVADKQFAGVGEIRECYFVRFSHIGVVPDRCYLYFYEVQLRPNEQFLIFKSASANPTWTTTFNYDVATTTPTFSVKIIPPQPVLKILEAGQGNPNLIQFFMSVPSNSSPDGYTTKELTFIKYAENEVVLSKHVEESVTSKPNVQAQPQPQSSLQLGPNAAFSHIIPFECKKSQSLDIARKVTNPTMLRLKRPKSMEVQSEGESPEFSFGPIFNTKILPLATLVVTGSEFQFNLRVEGPNVRAWDDFGMTVYTILSRELPEVQTTRDEKFTVTETSNKKSVAHFSTFKPKKMSSIAHMFVKTPSPTLGYTVHGIGPLDEILLGAIDVTLSEYSVCYDTKEYELKSDFTGKPGVRFIVTSVTDDHSFFDVVRYNGNKKFISEGCIRWFSKIRQEIYIHVYLNLTSGVTKFFLTLVVTDQRVVFVGTTECRSYTVESVEATWLERNKKALQFVVMQCNIPRQFSEYKAEDIKDLKNMTTAEKYIYIELYSK